MTDSAGSAGMGDAAGADRASSGAVPTTATAELLPLACVTAGSGADDAAAAGWGAVG